MEQLANLVATLQARVNTGDRGATAVEYGLMIAAIAVAVAAVVFFLGDDIAGLFTDVQGDINQRSTTTTP